ncbi:hypothetical protein A2U01_0102084, partial [Trifolium medium]|nr:hypothetical protein [Trifolium medium]
MLGEYMRLCEAPVWIERDELEREVVEMDAQAIVKTCNTDCVIGNIFLVWWCWEMMESLPQVSIQWV